MSIHYAPLIIGAAIGAAVTYLLKDEKAKNSLQSGLRKTGETLNSGVEKVTSSVEKVASGFTGKATEQAAESAMASEKETSGNTVREKTNSAKPKSQDSV